MTIIEQCEVVSVKDARKYERFKELEVTIQSEFIKSVGSTGRYWLAIWEVWKYRLWEAGGYDSQELWIASMKGTTYGPSRTQLLKVMKIIDLMLARDMTRSEVEFAIGVNHAAIIHDLDKWFDRIGKNTYSLKPEVAQRLDDDGMTFGEAVMQLASLSSAEARDQVSITAGETQVYAHSAEWVDDSVYAAEIVVRKLNGVMSLVDIQVTLSAPDQDVREFISRRLK